MHDCSVRWNTIALRCIALYCNGMYCVVLLRIVLHCIEFIEFVFAQALDQAHAVAQAQA